ncbi:MAG: site-2 protease family protein [Myxococcales bacterium]
MDSQQLLWRVMMLVPMILSLTVHEFAHAWSAAKLGDDTAERMGRLTLNPLSHIDLIGTILLPLMGIPFGWAKPVPVNPVRFNRKVTMSTGMMITAAAGPISNMILAVLCTVIYGLLIRYAPQTLVSQSTGDTGVSLLLQLGITINVALALFNLIPVPPLDGSRVVDGLIPARMRSRWENFTRLAPFLLIGVMVFGGVLIRGPSRVAHEWLNALLRFIAS